MRETLAIFIVFTSWPRAKRAAGWS